MSPPMRAEYDDLTLADVESAKPSAAFMSNVIVDKKEHVSRLAEERRRREAEARKDGS